jgi:predicted nucleic acid-binding protein
VTFGYLFRQHDLTLLTNNRRHFENIEGLRIESA